MREAFNRINCMSVYAIYLVKFKHFGHIKIMFHIVCCMTCKKFVSENMIFLESNEKVTCRGEWGIMNRSGKMNIDVSEHWDHYTTALKHIV